MADADPVVPSTRRSRRDGEREAEHRALYAESAQPSSTMRIVDGGSPMYRTRREMRESASQLARDLPVIVEPTAHDDDVAPVPAATGATAPAGRRARRLAQSADQSAVAAQAASGEQPETVVDQPAIAEQAQPVADEGAAAASPQRPSRRTRRSATIASAPEPAVAQAVEAASAPEAAPAAPLAGTASRRSRRIASVPADQAPAEQAAVAPSAAGIAAAPAAPEPTASPEPASTGARVVTRAERRAAQAASSDEVSAAVAAVLGSEQDDVASTPVRSPLRREVRPPRQAVVARRPAPHAPVVRPSRRARSGAARKAMQRIAAAGVILSICSFVAVTSLPAQAFSPSEPTSTTGAYGDVEVEQQLDVTTGSGPHGDEEVTAVLTRDDFGVDDALASARIDADELAALQAVADSEEIGPYYGGDPAMPGVWAQLETTYTQSPFPSLAEVPVSSGFGYRWGSFHGGVDLVPGAGTPVFPVANGVVIATWQGNNPGGGGYEVIVEHNIDGQYFQSWYPHMQAGSIQVEPGQVVDITTQLGAVGSTGRSTGAHLHLEIKNGDYISVDPLVWLATREQILEP